jgi:hypothetical protein
VGIALYQVTNTSFSAIALLVGDGTLYIQAIAIGILFWQCDGLKTGLEGHRTPNLTTLDVLQKMLSGI